MERKRAVTGPWGRAHLALATRRKAHRFESSLRPCAPGGACEGKMPSPPGPVAVARARTEGKVPSLLKARPWSGSGSARRPPSEGPSRWKEARGDGPLGARASCPRYAPQGASVRKWLKAMRAWRRVRGQDALAPRAPSLLRGHVRKAECLPSLRPVRGRGPAARDALPPRARPGGGKCAATGPWGRGHLALAMRRRAHRFESSLRPCAPGGACEGKMPSPPGPVAVARARREGRMSSLQGSGLSAGRAAGVGACFCRFAGHFLWQRGANEIMVSNMSQASRGRRIAECVLSPHIPLLPMR